MDQNLNDALTEVRKAYRLLADYQKKVLDLVGFIGNSFGRNYHGGYSKYGEPTPRNGKGNLGLWSWDWLIMYFYEFHFGKEVVNEDEVFFSVFLISDTGYYNEKRNNKGLDKNETESFTSPADSDTKLIFLVGKNRWELGDVFAENFNKPEFVLSEEGHEKGDNGIMIFKSYPLIDFANQVSAEIKMKDFEAYCKKFDIDFKLIEKKLS